ncbi:MAG: PEGA domain-containing protein, partial [Thermoplasmatales archaeon]|nr:PEGA domain-containing protein [Thermoplasmatales archaeon]
MFSKLVKDYGLDVTTKTQEKLVAIIQDATVDVVGRDDLIWLGYVKVESAYVDLNPVGAVKIGKPLNVSGTTKREQYVICDGKNEKTKKEGNGRWQRAIISIAMAAIMLSLVFAAMIGSTGAYSVGGGEYNIIEKYETLAQKVLIGQSLEFRASDNWDIPNVSVSSIEDIYLPDVVDNTVVRYYDVSWPTDSSFYVNAIRDTSTNKVTKWDAQLSVEDPSLPLDLKVGVKSVSSIAVGTDLIVDMGGVNLFDEDVVDLKIFDPDGVQIKTDDINNQPFTGKDVKFLRDHYGTAPGINTDDWEIGTYTFQLKSKPENACGLEMVSIEKALTVIKAEIDIEAEKTSVVELEKVKLAVAGVPNHNMAISSSNPAHTIFPAGYGDNPPYDTSGFDDIIGSPDGKKEYVVYFDDTGTYTITATDTTAGSDDSVEIPVSEAEPGLTAEQPRNVIAEGDDYTIEGTATGMDKVDIVLIGPKGYSSKDLGLDVLNGLEIKATSVDSNDEFDEDITMSEGLDTGQWIALALSPGRDSMYAYTKFKAGQLTDVFEEKGKYPVFAGKDQTHILAIIQDNTIDAAGSDDLLVALTFKVEPPPFGSISVSSDPSGADIYLDGEYKGMTPKTISDIISGDHEIELKKSGYENWSDSVYVEAGETKNVSKELIPKTGSISITSKPSDAKIYLDGEYKGMTPKTISDVISGDHEI